jgi:hypothetical protein
MGRPSRYAPEVRERAVRLVEEQLGDHESEWAAMRVRVGGDAVSGREAGLHDRDVAQVGFGKRNAIRVDARV